MPLIQDSESAARILPLLGAIGGIGGIVWQILVRHMDQRKKKVETDQARQDDRIVTLGHKEDLTVDGAFRLVDVWRQDAEWNAEEVKHLRVEVRNLHNDLHERDQVINDLREEVYRLKRGGR